MKLTCDALAMLSSLAVLGGVVCPAYADAISGRPTVTDGDTLRFIGGIKVRLFGIDTPEKTQRCEANGACYQCGKEAADYVRSIIGDQQVTCEFTGDKSYDRYVAICSVGKRDLGEAVIAAGWALPYEQFLRGHRLERSYTSALKTAQSKALGMNRGRFIPPEDWRRHKMRLECER